MSKPLGYGLIGCGGFGHFSLESYRVMPEIRCAAVTDVDASLAASTAARYGTAVCASAEELLARNDVDIVHIATPPFTHPRLATLALNAGKHVLCEKPPAIDSQDARAMAALSERKELLLAVNLIMRYNPLCEIVKAIIERKILGEPLHAQFINDAKDEQLPPEHWFWDRKKSGGIFIEHGVHFFDVFAWWFGEGRVTAAQQTARPENGVIEQVACTVQYGSSTLGYFYHGFHQVGRMDRQHWAITCEMGTITMREWTPTEMHIDFLGDDATVSALRELVPEAEIAQIERYTGSEERCTGRHKPHVVSGRYSVSYASDAAKPDLYARMLRSLLRDQIAFVYDAAHRRRLNEADAVASLEQAVEAQRLAELVS